MHAHKAQIDAVWQPNELSALMAASRAGHAEAVTALCAAKASVDAASKDGRSASYFAAEEGHASVITALLAGKADTEQGRKGSGSYSKPGRPNASLRTSRSLTHSLWKGSPLRVSPRPCATTASSWRWGSPHGRSCAARSGSPRAS